MNGSHEDGPEFRGPLPAAVGAFHVLIDGLAEVTRAARDRLTDNEQRLAQHEADLLALSHGCSKLSQKEALTALSRLSRGSALILQQLQSENRRIDDRIRKVLGEIDQFADKRRPYEPSHEQTLRDALRRLKILDEHQQLPPPDGRLSGVGDVSRVYPVHIPGTAGGVKLIAKFDRPDRAAREWKKLDGLRNRSLGGIQLPINIATMTQDKVLIYRAAQNLTQSLRIDELLTFLRLRLRADAFTCADCMSRTLETLRAFHDHEPGKRVEVRRQNRPAQWWDVFDLVGSVVEKKSPTAGPGARSKRDRAELIDRLSGHATRAWSPVDWSAKVIRVKAGRTVRELPNPLTPVATRLDTAVGSAWQSRVHGDMNYTNVLVGVEPDKDPTEYFVIDLGLTEADQVTALDFARLESEFWLEVFPGAVSEAGTGEGLVSAMVRARDWLDGRSAVPPEPIDDPVWAACVVVQAIRGHARKVLGRDQPRYCFEDYFHCLYFRALEALRFERIRDDKPKARASLLGAALALLVLSELQQGAYGKSRRRRFPTARLVSG